VESKGVEFIEAESRMVVAKGGTNVEMLVKKCKILVTQEE
jgi:hypothetical protein